MSKLTAATTKACPLLTSNPNNLVEWEKKIYLLVATEHGNSNARYMHSNKAPLYVRMPEYLYGDLDADEVDNIDYDAVEYTKKEIEDWERDHPVPKKRDNEVANSRYKSKSDRWTKKRQDWIDAQERIFPLVTLHISDDSILLISQLHKEEWENARGKNDCITQIRLIRETHTMRSVTASRAEKKLARNSLLEYTQGLRETLQQYTHNFETRLTNCQRIEADVDLGEVIYAYLTHITDSDITDEVGYLVGQEGKDGGDYPTTLEEAKSQVTKLKAKKEELIIARGGSRLKAGAPQDAPAVHYAAKSGENGGRKSCQQSADPSKRDAHGEIHITAAELLECVCAYCSKSGHIAQHCFRLLRDVKDKGNKKSVNDESSATAPPDNNKRKKEDKQKRKNKSTKEVNLAHVEYGMLTTLPLMQVTDTSALLAKVEGVTSTTTILDTGANINVANDIALLSDVRKIAPVQVKGVSKRTIKTTTAGTFGDFGLAYFIPTSPYNIVAFSAIKTLHTMTYDGSEDKFVCLDKDNNKVLHSFECMRSTGLYNLCGPEVLVTTAVFTPEQISRMDGVEELHQALLHPGDDALGDALEAGTFANCKYTRQDLKNLRTFRGKCIHCMKGKTTAEPVPVASASPPPPYIGHTLHQDIVFVNKVPYLLSTDGLYNYSSVVPLKTKGVEHLVPAIKSIVAHFKAKDKVVKIIRTDNEAVFRACLIPLNEVGVELKLSPPGTHESRIERVVRVVRERVRTELSVLHNQFKLPPALYPHLFADIITMKNIVPNKNTQGKSPRRILFDEVTDMADIGPSFGTVAAFRDPNIAPGDKSAPRVSIGIVAGRDLLTKGSVRVYLIDSKQFVNRSFKMMRQVPLTRDIVNKINLIAEADLERMSNVGALHYSPLDRRLHQQTAVAPSTTSVLSPSPRQAPPTMSTGFTADSRSETTDDLMSINPSRTVAAEVDTDITAGEVESLDHPVAADEVVDAEKGVETASIVEENDTGRGIKAAVESDQREEVKQQINNKEQESNIDSEMEEKLRVDMVPVASDKTYSLRNRDGITKPSRYANLVSVTLAELGLIQPVALNMTVKQALKKHDKEARKAIGAEMSQLLSRKVWRGLLSKKQASHSKHKNILPSSMFLKEKYRADGVFDKIKARLVAGGHRADADKYSWQDKSSPTVCLESVMIVLCIAAVEKRKTEAIDFPGAYLNASLHEPQVMRLDKILAEEVVKIDPSYEKFVQSDGTMLVELLKALYGLPEAAKLWYMHLRKALLEIGYKCSSSDPCLFHREKNGEKSTLCLYVDDMLHTFTGDKLYQELHDGLAARYDQVTVQKLERGSNISYLGMDLRRNSLTGGIQVSMPSYVREILEVSGIQGKAKTPASNDFFDIDSTSKKLEKNEAEKFVSLLMKLMYLAKRVRYDILMACTFLATRLKEPTVQDMDKLVRVLKYLNATEHLYLTLLPSDLQLHVYADASYAVHGDAKGHSGRIISLGKSGGPVYLKSTKQKLVSRSSTEAELISFADAASDTLWILKLLRFLGINCDHALFYQDNKSTIFMLENGESSATGNSKHIDVRYFFTKQHIDSGLIKITHLPTDDMLADVLTKPLQGTKFYHFRSALLNSPSPDTLIASLV